jgi:hypothetical protein
MLFIHNISCISPQQSFSDIDLEKLNESVENKLKAIEPSYEGIPLNSLRRMGKAVRISVGAALPLFKNLKKLDGIIIGTANGGMEDCIKFMNQIIQYEEGMLTPGNFVQSTPNGIAAQLGLLQSNNNYNITHVHRGLSFENAVLDAAMMLNEFPDNTYLLGATDEISTYNYNVDYLGGWYKKEIISNKELYTATTPASIAGEGAVMFEVSGKKKGALAEIKAMHMLHSNDVNYVMQELSLFMEKNCKENLDLLITGENGDARFLNYYEAAEKLVDETTPILRYKHMSGDYPTASSQAVWLACQILQQQKYPKHCLKKGASVGPIKTILIYNNYKGEQHSFILVSS